MLVKMRKFAGTWIMAIFSFMIILSFAVWGVGDIFRGRTSNTVVTVGDIEIAGTELSREFRRQMSQMQRLFGGTLDAEQARNLGLDDRALNALVARALYDLEAENLGLAVSDDFIRDAIQGNPNFHNQAGVFDRAIFDSVISRMGYGEQRFIALMRAETIRSQLLGSLVSAVPTPKFAVDALYRHREERRAASYVVVTNDSITGLAEPSETALERFHGENAAQFTAPEYRAFTFIHLTVDDVIDEIGVAEDEVQAEYDERRDLYVTPEKRDVEQILLPDEAAARAAYAALMSGEDFLAVAERTTGATGDAVALGKITRGDLFGAVTDMVFALGVDEIGEPLESPFGWHIFRVRAVDPEYARPFAEVRDALEREIALRGAADVLHRLAKRLDDELGGGATIEKAGAALQLPVTRIDGVDDAGLGPNDLPVAGLPTVRGFLSTAYATPEGDASLLIESDDGSYFVLRVDGVTPPTLRPLDSIRGEVIRAWRAAERDRLAAARATEAAERINGGTSMATVAGDLGLDVTVGDPVRRDGDGAALQFSNDLVRALFSGSIGDAVSAPSRSGSGHVVARLDEIVAAARGSDGDARRASIRAEMQGAMANDLTTQYRMALEARYPVKINRGAVDALF